MNTRWIANTASSQPPDRKKHFAVFQLVSCVDLFYLDMTEVINIKMVHQLRNMNGIGNFLPNLVPFSLLSKLCVVAVSNKKAILLSCLVTCILHLPSSRRKHIHERRSTKELTDSSTPNSQVIEAFSLCMFLFCTFYQTLPSGPPCSKQQGHRLQARHKIRCLWDPGRGMTRTQFQCWFHLCIYYKSITGSLYAALG